MASARPHDALMSAISIRHSPPLETTRGVIARLRGLLERTVPPETPAEAADRRAAERSSAGLELAQCEARRDVELPKLAAAEEKAKHAFEALVPAYRAAAAALDRAQAAHSRRAHDFSYERERLIRRIEAAAEPVIEECKQDLYRLLEANRKTDIITDERTTTFDLQRHAYDIEVWSNVPSINARSVAILAAINEVEGMKSDPDQATIRERLIALIEALPDPTIVVKPGRQ